jgi:hypothetical protein
VSYQSAFLNARPELQKMLLGLDQADPNVQTLLRVLRGIDYEISKASMAFIPRFSVEQNQDGWGRDVPGMGLCGNDHSGNLVRYTDHLNALAIALAEKQE